MHITKEHDRPLVVHIPFLMPLFIINIKMGYAVDTSLLIKSAYPPEISV